MARVSESECRRLLNECPTVIGIITSCIESGGSSDTAIRTVASDGPRLSRRLFTDAVRKADTRSPEGTSGCLMGILSDLPDCASGYVRAMQMCLTASESPDGEERRRMLMDASDVALDSVRGMGESYSASLNVPCMTVFGLGIMAPMILMSILPMLGVGGLFGSRMLDPRMISAITLVLIPSVLLAIAAGIRSRNPFISGELDPKDIRFALPLLISVPMSAVYLGLGWDADGVLMFSVTPAAIVSLTLMASRVRSESVRRRCEEGMHDAVFDIGNRMMSGENYGSACIDALGSRPVCAGVSESMQRELEICRGDVEDAVRRSVSAVSDDAFTTYRDILRCSEVDTEDAGRLAVSLGRQFHNRTATMRDLENRLKSVTDMMFGTAMVFAPLVLGMSVAMLEPLSDMAGYSGMEGTTMILSAYVVELCALISLITACLGRGRGLVGGLWRFCVMCPVALIVFDICSGISI